MAVLTKAQGEILDWTTLDDTATDNPFAETGTQTFADEMEVLLNIVVAHADTNDATTNYVTTSVLVRDGADAEGWRLLTEFQSGGGQATAEALDANSGAGQPNPERIQVVGTGDWDDGLAHWLFLQDAGTLVDSCLCLPEGWADADYYINAWDLVNAYDAADSLYDTVSQHTVQLPASVEFFNVTFHNSDAAAVYAVKVDWTEVSSIA